MVNEVSLNRIDYAFSKFIGIKSELKDEQRKNLECIIAKLSNIYSQGHSFLEVNDEDESIIILSGMAANETSPLVLVNKQLYLQRYWGYEAQLAEKLKEISKGGAGVIVENAIINRYFPITEEVDWQREAAKATLDSYLTIITGGPGTGKTTTIVKILALLQELSETPFNIALAAPTGKAANRLQESIAGHKNGLNCSDLIKEFIPEQVVTIHRLLGAKPPSPYFRYDAKCQLPYDIVVIDEVSMIDLPLMSKLVAALKVGARLILLGDKDQLSSVDVGSVLADLSSALPEHTQELKTTYRFSQNIQEFSQAINLQKAELAWEVLKNDDADVCELKGDLINYIADKYVDYLSLITQSSDFIESFNEFSKFQVLCATRQGLNSVSDINSRVTLELRERKLIAHTAEWYSGRPIMVTQNDSVLQLYNGDIGICMPDVESSGQLMVFFVLANGVVRKYMPARLPHCETVYAMTIHKSQGSEFDEVLLILPDKVSPILTKELIYTGITRSKKVIKLYTTKEVFLQTVQRKVERFSGLADKLKNSLS